MQSVSHLLGRPLPPQPGELGAAHVPAVAPSVQPRASQETAQTCRLTRIGRYSVDCVWHGRVAIEELSLVETLDPARAAGVPCPKAEGNR